MQTIPANFVDSAELAIVVKHYLIAAIWADSPEGTQPRATVQAVEKAKADCLAFIAKNYRMYLLAMACDGYGSHPDAGSPQAAFGHDLWLTRQGCGTGFYDREALHKKLREALSDAARQFGECYPSFYRGWLYFD